MRTQGLSVPELNAGVTVAAARRMLASAFVAGSLDTPDLDARLLVGHALRLTHAALAREAARALTAAEADAVAALLARLSECPLASGAGTDVSRNALACARDNARALGLADRASFTVSDYGKALAGPFDLVVSNPPYVRRDEVVTLQPEVRAFDPPRALDGGTDGLDAYRAIAADARRLLKPDGVIVVELGQGQLGAVAALFAAASLAVEAPRYDL